MTDLENIFLIYMDKVEKVEDIERERRLSSAGDGAAAGFTFLSPNVALWGTLVGMDRSGLLYDL